MKRRFLFSVLMVLGIAMNGFTQIYHSVGAGLVYGKGNIPEGAETGSDKPMIFGYGIFYNPRYNITESESGALSIGLPLTVGLTGSVNSREGGSISIIADLPVTIDYNFGAGSTDYNESGFGGFIGVGFGYTYSNYTDEFYIPGTASFSEQVKGTSYGPLVNGGLRAYIGERTYFLRGFYKIGLENAKFKTFGVSVGVAL